MAEIFFTPDIFSRFNPRFEDISQDILEEINNVLLVHYSHLGNVAIMAEQLSGLEINSRNFKVCVGSGTYAFKRINHKLCRASYSNQLALTQQLLKQGIQFPRIVHSDEGTLFSVQNDDYIWVLAEFVEGDYFSGRRDYFFAIAHAIGNLQHSLETIDPSGIPLSIAAGSWNHTNNIIIELFQRENDWERLFPKAESDAFRREGRIIEKSLKFVADRIPYINSKIVPTHIDLHPHNILINSENTPVFVDVDSIQRAERTQSLAFATYKLARQYVVYEGLTTSKDIIAKDTRCFVDTIIHTAGLQDIEIKDFPILATAEVLRRIALIAELNMNKGNQKWNAVLHMHLMALYEIPLLFSDFK
jgi:Ser/Thr protein kinase RdoA (MazF antagonist)